MFPGTKIKVFRLYRMSLLSFAPGTSLNSSRDHWVSTTPFADFGWLFAPVLFRLSPISVHFSSTAFFAVGFWGRNLHHAL